MKNTLFILILQFLFLAALCTSCVEECSAPEGAQEECDTYGTWNAETCTCEY